MPSKLTPSKCGMTISYTFETPIGKLELMCCPAGVHTLSLEAGITDDTFSPQQGLPVVISSQDNDITYKSATDCLHWLNTYFNIPHRPREEAVEPAICTQFRSVGPFTGQVWSTLRQKVGFGQTISYKNLGGLCGNPKSCRAVGQAMRNNPVILITPCHRVVPENGGLGNYDRGTKNRVKEWLLRHEGAIE